MPEMLRSPLSKVPWGLRPRGNPRDPGLAGIKPGCLRRVEGCWSHCNAHFLAQPEPAEQPLPRPGLVCLFLTQLRRSVSTCMQQTHVVRGNAWSWTDAELRKAV